MTYLAARMSLSSPVFELIAFRCDVVLLFDLTGSSSELVVKLGLDTNFPIETLRSSATFLAPGKDKDHEE